MHIEESESIERKLLALDAARCKAINDCDLATLSSLIHSRLSHVHQSGKVVGKMEFMEGIAQRPRHVTRSDVRSTTWTDVAVMTGKQVNLFPDSKSVQLFVTQLWIQESGEWQQVSFHCCKLTEDN